MSISESKERESLLENKRLWEEEIIRETEHYYQGEMRQEERGSWLLATASALTAILLSVASDFFEEGENLSEILILIPATFFIISAIIAIIGMLPYSGTKGIRVIFKRKPDCVDKPIDAFIKYKFRLDGSFSEEALEKRIFYHFKNHYIRNYQKSRKVIWSSIFLLLGLIVSFIMILCMIINSN